MANRLRNRDVHLRVTDYEYEMIKAGMQESGYSSMREYLSYLLKYGYVISKDMSGTNSLAYEINKIGVNINQAVHLANLNENIDSSVIEELSGRLDQIYDKVNNFIKLIS